MPEREEIEAVAQVLEGATSMFPNPPHAARYYAEKAIEALDRVRDARGDDEDEGPKWLSMDDLSYKGGGVMGRRAALSPQDEDHEAGDLYRRKVYEHEDGSVSIGYAPVSPSRDGTVAVEDVIAWLDSEANRLAGNGELSDTVAGAVVGVRMRLLAEFGSARAGESNEGGNQ